MEITGAPPAPAPLICLPKVLCLLFSPATWFLLTTEPASQSLQENLAQIELSVVAGAKILLPLLYLRSHPLRGAAEN